MRKVSRDAAYRRKLALEEPLEDFTAFYAVVAAIAMGIYLIVIAVRLFG